MFDLQQPRHIPTLPIAKRWGKLQAQQQLEAQAQMGVTECSGEREPG